ncbi:NUDIX domain-containing protein [Aaosphaeria arxii CBS 175.79]|uniref:NUDIX domain-containing protein n=1 Tax=Aaosphaeria arxii CBS 175.79 TaxID=1450172 RepID=A0A6A5Y0C2_9PLEO|nr:NUDIX domain-containing protein [Aaosphaeria arxii CBS 175.79]KAF2018633.1 NUDIX domain-containing protein [Aaosphaeria arxii CBS 175.79]
MAQSPFPNQQLTSSQFVESCGAILFSLPRAPASNLEVCILKYLLRDQYILPKGRRNVGESRAAAALREVTEETGYTCKLLPVTMATRATDSKDDPGAGDRVRMIEESTEPFMVTVRQLGGEKGAKIIWWFIAVVSKTEDGSHGNGGEDQFQAEWYSCEDAVERLHFETDRDVLRTAISLVQETIKSGKY